MRYRASTTVNLALFPITALLLLLSGVGTPAHAADGRQSATALIKAILGSNGEGQGLARLPHGAAHRQPSAARQPFAKLAPAALPSPLEAARLGGSANRKAYRTRFGLIDGAHQPQGPPNRPLRALLG